MTSSRKYCVAGHEFIVNFPAQIDAADLLASYKPFQIEDAKNPAFELEVKVEELPYPGELIQMYNDESPFIWLYRRKDNGINFGFSFTTEAPTSILDFNGAKALLTLNPAIHLREADNAIGNAMMLLFAYNTGPKDTLMIHASVSVKDGLGYIFLGKSGTGKSTHSRQWMERYPDVELLNDDNPVLRFIDGKTWVFGTPWSGKTPCYKNKSVPAQAIVQLEQWPENIIQRLSPIMGYAALMPSCSSMKWDKDWADAEHATLEKVIMSVGCWHLKCLPDHAAAELCYNSCKPQ